MPFLGVKSHLIRAESSLGSSCKLLRSQSSFTLSADLGIFTAKRAASHNAPRNALHGFQVTPTSTCAAFCYGETDVETVIVQQPPPSLVRNTDTARYGIAGYQHTIRKQ